MINITPEKSIDEEMIHGMTVDGGRIAFYDDNMEECFAVQCGDHDVAVEAKSLIYDAIQHSRDYPFIPSHTTSPMSILTYLQKDIESVDDVLRMTDKLYDTRERDDVALNIVRELDLMSERGRVEQIKSRGERIHQKLGWWVRSMRSWFAEHDRHPAFGDFATLVEYCDFSYWVDIQKMIVDKKAADMETVTEDDLTKE